MVTSTLSIHILHVSLHASIYYVHMHVPQAVSGPKKEEQRERVLWASFETGDVNDLTMEHLAPPPGGNCSHLPLLLTLGFANGFSIWMINVSQ